MYFIYILKSINHEKTYTGYTTNIEKRIKEHNTGSSVFSSMYKPWKLIYSENCNSQLEAIKREKYLKSAAGRRWIKKNIFNS